MDIFRILSKSTKLGNKHADSKSSATLPSGGQNINPQLFGPPTALTNNLRDDADSEVVSVLGKRKRKDGNKDALPRDLDFFGNGERNKSCQKDNTKSPDAAGEDAETTSIVSFNGNSSERMDEEDERRLLKSHKIKITILSSEDIADSMPASNKKDKKKLEKRRSKNAIPKLRFRTQVYPKPLTTFAQLRSRYSLSKRLFENLSAQGYKVPTEVQLAALPLLMGDPCVPALKEKSKKNFIDLLTVAPTGSGKTLAFLVPIISSILSSAKEERDSRTQAIILAPTRELANQIVNEGRKLVQNTGIRISLMRKGMTLEGAVETTVIDEDQASPEESDSEDDRDAKDLHPQTIIKAHIVVSTPLVLVNSLNLSSVNSQPLSELRHLVLDEADVLLDPLFREQVEAVWNLCTHDEMRVSLWSATMASSIEEFIVQQLSKLGHIDRAPIVRLVVGLKDTALPTLTHTMTYTGTESGKLLSLRQLLHPTAPATNAEGRKSLRPPFIVFTQTIERAKALQAELRYDIPPEAGGSARMAALHSEMSERAREKVMTDFRRGEVWVIITTDLLARGVDFRGLNGVVNYDIPTTAAAYIHRVGRTGRAGREGGVAVTLYTKDDIPYVKPIANVIAASERLRSQGDVDRKGLQQWLIESLPTPSKREKKELKKKGAEARRSGTKSAMISTKSGYDRKMANRKREIRGTGHRVGDRKVNGTPKGHEQSDFAGFDD